MSDTPRLIGYDSRVPPGYARDEWDEVRRGKYLIRPEVANPRSVDTMVWSAIDDNVPFPQAYDELGYGFLGLVATPIPQLSCNGACIAIAVYPDSWTAAQRDQWDTLIRSKEGQNIGYRELHDETIALPDPRQFVFLGYDIADSGLISGLSNCDWQPEELAQAREQWSAALNGDHLFDEMQAATEFARFCDSRVQEHAPFYVFGLWMRS